MTHLLIPIVSVFISNHAYHILLVQESLSFVLRRKSHGVLINKKPDIPVTIIEYFLILETLCLWPFYKIILTKATIFPLSK